MISCSCDYDDYDIVAVRKPRYVTCRTARACDDCGSMPGSELKINYNGMFVGFRDGYIVIDEEVR